MKLGSYEIRVKGASQMNALSKLLFSITQIGYKEEDLGAPGSIPQLPKGDPYLRTAHICGAGNLC